MQSVDVLWWWFSVIATTAKELETYPWRLCCGNCVSVLPVVAIPVDIMEYKRPAEEWDLRSFKKEAETG